MLSKDTTIFASYHPSDKNNVLTILENVRKEGWLNVAISTEHSGHTTALVTIQQSELILLFLSKAFARDERLMLEEFAYSATVVRKPFISVWLDKITVIQQDYKDDNCDKQLLSALEMLTAKQNGTQPECLIEMLEQYKQEEIPYTPSTPQICEKPCEAYDGDEPYIFISYAHDDALQVYPVIKELYESGWDLWYDEGIKTTERYLPVIAHHVNKCSIFVLMLTNRSLDRPFVMNYELEYSRQRGIPVVTVLLEEIKSQHLSKENVAQLIKSAIMPGKLLDCIGTVGLKNRGVREAIPPVVKQNVVYDVDLPPELAGFEFAVQNNGITITRYIGDDKDVIIPSSVKSHDGGYIWHIIAIGKGAFSGCTRIKSVDIPDGVVSIELYAFSRCESLTRVKIGEGISNINMHCFSGCQSLKELLLPDSCEEIKLEGEVCIYFRTTEICPHLDVIFNRSRTTIFYYPANNTANSYVIPEGVTRISSRAFFECRSLQRVTIPSSVKYIENGAFACTNLIAVNLPESIETISDDMFYGCYNLFAVVIPSSVTKIGTGAFEGCKSLTMINIPKSVTSIGKGAFKDTSLESDVLDKYADIITDTSTSHLKQDVSENILLPQCKEEPRALICCAENDIQRISMFLAELYWEGFNLYYNVSSNKEALKDSQCILVFFTKNTPKCTQTMNILKEAINHDVSRIIQIFLDDCDWPDEIKNKLHDRQAIFKSSCSERDFTGRIRNGLRQFGCDLGHPRGFDVQNCGDYVEIKKFHPTDFLHVVVPKTFFKEQLPVTMIGYSAFSDNLSNAAPFKSIVLPDTIKTIGDDAFRWATGLENLSIPDGVTHIGNYVFLQCLSLSYISIPESVTSIGINVFPENDAFTIFAKCGSYAWEYARENNIRCYDGEVMNGMPHGKGKIIMINGIYYDGNFSYGKCHGRGKVTLPSGNTYEGIFNENSYCEKNKMIFDPGMIYDSIKQEYVPTCATVYEGDFLNNSPHGNGKLWYADRRVYEGEFFKGKSNGIGKLTLPTEPHPFVYEGDFVDNRMHGKGKKTHANGDFYEGEWANDKYHGFGRHVYTCIKYHAGDSRYASTSYKDREVYEGDFVDNRKHGKGKVTYANGDFYEGDWVNDKYHGFGLLSKDGNTFEGNWVDGKLHGFGRYAFPDGSVYEGDFVDNRKHGKGKVTHVNDESYEGDWVSDKYHGLGRYVFKNGNIYEGEFIGGKQSKGKFLSKDGSVCEGDWVDGKLHGFGRYTTPDGSVYEGEWIDGKPNDFKKTLPNSGAKEGTPSLFERLFKRKK